MLTPQEVEERVFPKAKKGGYDMQDVDNFLDQLTADYSELYKENAVLKRKMKVLADKITEYQETEGAMRATLLAAQKMADQIVEEANAKKARILEETEAIARERVGSLSDQVVAEQERLKEAKASVAAMTAGIRELLAQEQAFLDSLPPMEEEPSEEESAPAEDITEAVATEIGDSIRRIMSEDETAEAQPAAPAAEESAPAAPAEEPAAEPAPEEPAAEPARPAPQDDVDTAPTRRLDLSELRFGRNYEIK